MDEPSRDAIVSPGDSGATIPAPPQHLRAAQLVDTAARDAVTAIEFRPHIALASCRPQDVRAFVLELVATLQAVDALDNPAPVVQVIAAWQHTAEVHANPDPAARIHLLEGDLGPVPEPTA